MTKRILVIDDERDVRGCVANLLSLLPDCEVESVATYAEGRSRAQEAWDLVISDFALPDGNGVDLLDAYARAHPGRPRVLMSAYNAPEVVAALEAPTPLEFIQKPFDPDHVLEHVQRLLGPRRA